MLVFSGEVASCDSQIYLFELAEQSSKDIPRRIVI